MTRDMESSTPEKDMNSTRTFVRELIHIALIAAFIVLPIRLFIAQPFIVNGASMAPTFQNGDYLIVDELSYHFSSPVRGDVVVFRFPEDPSKFFIKRVIGLPGETVSIANGATTITGPAHPEPLVLDESFVISESRGTYNETLGEDEYFVMGDNRPASSDSRFWGPLPRDNIVGHAFVRLFPLRNAEFLPGDINKPPDNP